MTQQEFELQDNFLNKDTEKNELSSNQNQILNEEVEYQIGKQKVFRLSIAFMTLFIAYGSCTSLISGLYKTLNFTNLGLMSLFSTYFTFAFASFVAKGIIQKFSFRVVFTISNLGYTACIAAGIWVFLCEGSEQQGVCSIEAIYSIVNFTAALCGVCASTLWVAQGGYVDIISSSCPSKRGVLIGQFFSFMSASNIIGYILASILLNFFGNMSYFILNSILSLVSAYMMYVLPEPYSPNCQIQNQMRNQQQIKPLIEQIQEVLVLLKDIKALYVIPYYWLQGVVLGCYASYIFVVVKYSLNEEQAQYAPQYVSYVVIFLGLSGVICGIVVGKLADKYNLLILAIGATLLVATAVLFSLLGLVVKEYALCFLIAILWGSCDSTNASLSVIIASKDFPGQLQMFSLQKLSNSLGCSFALIMGILLQNYPPYSILFVVFIFQIISTICLAVLLSLKSAENKA
ncbi:MFS transporter (macronuclear) [Tetrahymena thermophila SB210]|uniref:MFS transporter n=1 Tax=Tetrahymena thermophila (strain SB210) TaxID=312017 RepID=A4VED3_TETTS|nr:MFS transporter [Tetrahymena thermophila SB210]EDK31889.2 MFS transporter [Tetrahymena thermophila SB210]|eukprot:XP_001470747.2 MFS transporter [Tetrahymena thermophila SB210]